MGEGGQAYAVEKAVDTCESSPLYFNTHCSLYILFLYYGLSVPGAVCDAGDSALYVLCDCRA